jgi:hypothetical protein
MKAPTGPITLTQPIYDTVQQPIAAAVGSVLNFFQVPFAGVLAGAALKTFKHTNLVQAGRLEADVSMRITGITYFLPEISQGAARPTQVDARAIHAGCLHLFIGQTEYLTIPVCMIPNGGAEIALVSNIAAAVTEYQISNSISAAGNIYTLDFPLDLDPQESIRVQISDIGIVAAATDVCVMLHGAMTRPVR